MARPRTFDREEVLDRALQTFWTQGYEATSVEDLVQAMEINRASLYNTFGSKHELYVEVLDRYEQRWVRRVLDALRQDDSPRAAIRRLLETVADEAATCPHKRGCLMTNAATELGHRDADTTERVRANFQHIEDAFAGALERGQTLGEIPAEADARALARFLTNTLQGLRVLAKTSPDRDALQDVVDTALHALE